MFSKIDNIYAFLFVPLATRPFQNRFTFKGKNLLMDEFPSLKVYPVTLIHCILVDSSTVVFWTSLFVILGAWGLLCRFFSILSANTVDPDQTPHYGSAVFANDPFQDFQVRMG